MSYSLATPGCNFVCLFCQNWQISQAAPETVRLRELPPDRVVSEAGAAGCPSIAFTYTEPVVATEFVLDTARAARDSGIATVAISNGFYQESPLRELCRYLAAVKVDLKAFQDEFYRRCCAGRLAPVLRSLEIIREEDTWLELVVLLLPGLNDSPGEIRAMSRWVVQHLGPDVPLHFSRFHPAYRMKDLPPTPRETVIQARRIARQEGVRYAYVGNIPGQEGESTDCHQCSQPLIRRTGFLVRENRLARGKCPACGTVIPGVWS